MIVFMSSYTEPFSSGKAPAPVVVFVFFARIAMAQEAAAADCLQRYQAIVAMASELTCRCSTRRWQTGRLSHCVP